MVKVSPDEKALQYIALGRVNLVSVHPVTGLAEAEVMSSSGGDPYRVTHEDSAWSCDCPARVILCVHIRAVQKVVRAKPAPATIDGVDTDDWIGNLLDG